MDLAELKATQGKKKSSHSEWIADDPSAGVMDLTGLQPDEFDDPDDDTDHEYLLWLQASTLLERAVEELGVCALSREIEEFLQALEESEALT